MAGPDGADPEGTVNPLVQRRLRELAEQARSFRGNGEPPARQSDNPDPARYGLDKIYEYLHIEPNDWKPMPSIGPGVQEIRVHTDLEHRVFYIAKFSEGVYFLHAFEKRTRRTLKRDVELARDRLRALLTKRREDRATGG